MEMLKALQNAEPRWMVGMDDVDAVGTIDFHGTLDLEPTRSTSYKLFFFGYEEPSTQ